MEPDAEVGSVQLSPTNVNPRSIKYDLEYDKYATILSQIAMMITDNKLQLCLGMVPGTTTYTTRGFWKSATEGLRSTYVPTQKTHKTPSITSGTASEASHSVVLIFQIAEIETSYSRNTYPVYPSMPYGALPETFPKTPKILATDTTRSTYKLFPDILRIHPGNILKYYSTL